MICDFFLFLGILFIYGETCSVEFNSIFCFTQEFFSEEAYFYKLGTLFLFLGAMGKSAAGVKNLKQVGEYGKGEQTSPKGLNVGARTGQNDNQGETNTKSVVDRKF